MNEFWEIHKKMLVFLAVLAVATLIAWFAVGSSLYASMTRDSGSANTNYQENSKYYGSGTPFDKADEALSIALAKAGRDLSGLKDSLEMKFHEYIKIPKEQKRTKLTYFDTMLFETRESMARKAAFGNLKLPSDIGWADFVDIPADQHDKVVPEMLKKLSVTERVLSLLISSQVGKARVYEIQDIKMGEVYVGKVRSEYPDLVKHYPISLTFIASINVVNRFFDLIHYVELNGSKRRVGQYLQVEFFNIEWNDDNPTTTLKIQLRLSALEFLKGEENTTLKPSKKSEPGKPLGY